MLAAGLPVSGESTRAPRASTSLPRCRRKAPGPRQISLLFAPLSSPKITAATTQEHFCFPALRLRRAALRGEAAFAAAPKPKGSPKGSPVLRSPRQAVSVYSEQMDFPALGNTSEKKTPNYFSVAVTHAPDQHRSAHTALDRSVPPRALLRRMQNIVSGSGIHARKSSHSPQCSPHWFIKHHLQCCTNNNTLLGDKLELEQTAWQHAAALLAPTARSSARLARDRRSKPGADLPTGI